MSKSIDLYFELMKERPYLFKESEIIKIEMNKKELEKYERENNRSLGLLYRSKFNMLLVDLIKGGTGYYAYERIVPTSVGSAIVILAKYDNKFVLLKQYRHAIRDYQYALVRGFGEDNTSGEDNAKKELKEEIGAEVLKSEFLGKVASDSGLTSGIVEIYYCEITEPKLRGEEGIKKIELYTKSELSEKIRNKEITDSFTLAALKLYEEKI